jgi:adenylate cyclase
MGDGYRVRIIEDSKTAYESDFEGPLEIGRQGLGEGTPPTLGHGEGTPRLIVANLDETLISRRQLLVTPRTGGRLLLKNLSPRVPMLVEPGQQLPPNGTLMVSLPVSIVCGRRRFCLEASQAGSGQELQSLSAQTLAPGGSIQPEMSVQTSAKALESGDSEPLIRSIQAMIDVFHNAVDPAEFFSRAAQAIVELVGLDSGRVLLWKDGNWKPEALAHGPGIDASYLPRPSSRILEQVRQQKRTLWQIGAAQLETESLMDVQSVVASPLLSERTEVFGVLYGDRQLRSGRRSGPQITKLEALLVELLACGVASVLVRQKHQIAAQTQQIRFEQFFTKQLAAQLERQPDLLLGKEAEVSILFCDIRGFSRITQELGAAKTVALVNDVMEVLSEIVVESEGVLVDYVGDELMAMWGAPDEQPDHACRACRAALDMLGKIPELNARWKSVLNQSFSVGIGVNTGPVQVGNTGSHRKFKYGPLGNAVNLASRVQGATKYLHSPLLVTGTTFAQLGDPFRGRRLCSVQVVNIREPVQLFELVDQPPESWDLLRTHYEQALDRFERSNFRTAASLLSSTLTDFSDDGPSLLLLSRAVNALVDGPEASHPVWELPGK